MARPPKCRFCKVVEWNHVCYSQEERKPAEVVRPRVVLASVAEIQTQKEAVFAAAVAKAWRPPKIPVDFEAWLAKGCSCVERFATHTEQEPCPVFTPWNQLTGGELMPGEDVGKRINAGVLLRKAVKDGRVKKLPCQVGVDCDGRIEGHHPDYDKPLEVWWLCKKHHEAAHHFGLVITTQIEQPKGTLIHCEVCGQDKYVYRYGKFCSNVCRQKAKREKANKQRKEVLESAR